MDIMKKILIFSALLLISGILIAQNPVAYLSAAKGSVDLMRSAKTFKPKRGDTLENKDQLKTGGESFASYKFIDGNTNIKVFANSVVNINTTILNGNLNKSVSITKGSVLSKVISGAGTFQIETPTTVASVKGTGFLTKVADNEQTLIIVTEGEVLVEVKDTGNIQSVSKGSTARIEPNGSLSVDKTSQEDINDLEKAEIAADAASETKVMRIQVTDEQGNIKYIEVKY